MGCQRNFKRMLYMKNLHSQILKFLNSLIHSFSLSVILFGLVACHPDSKKASIIKAGNESPYEKLVGGNEHFYHLKPVHPDEDLQHLKEASKSQHPFAVVVCCSDSRVSPELIFDQGIGDLFVIRTAGNMIGSLELGSIEYAVEHLGVKLIVVMGHENCGAIKAFIEGEEAPGHIKDIIDSLKGESEIKAIPTSDKNRFDECVIANVQHGIKQLKTQSNIIHEKLEKGELKLLGARYDLDDFTVSFTGQR